MQPRIPLGQANYFTDDYTSLGNIGARLGNIGARSACLDKRRDGQSRPFRVSYRSGLAQASKELEPG